MEQDYFDYTEGMPHKQETEKKKSNGKALLFLGFFIGLLTAVFVIGGCFVVITLMNDSAGPKAAVKEGSVVSQEVIAKLNTLEKLIDEYYYLEEVPDEEIRNGVYKGMMSALNDPYTEYYTEEELNALMEQSQGVYYGIGAYVSIDSDTSLIRVSGIIDHSPAQDSDLRPNDLIYEISGVSTFGMSLTDAVALIKGEEGTDVTLRVIREGETDYLDIILTRRKVETPTVKFSMEESDIAYIQVTEFDDVTTDQFAEALAMAKGSKAKGILLDLRANPGGNLSTVVEMCRMILPEGMIVYTEDKKGKRSEYTCDGSHKLELPLVVLIDMNSASAAEIMAGAIKDYGIGTLVGTTTFGKGIVQQIMPFKDGSAVKMTISAYYTPKGNNIHGIGIEPDIVCEFDGKAYYASEDHPDNQLEKAKEVLMNLMR